MPKQEMTQVITNAHTYLIIGERKKSLDIMESLCKTFPNDKKLAETYKKIQTLDVEKESI
ncbi:hypothetical protein [Pedobacter sp. UYP1]|uniref:hypothetical protein n=1 Tax=Pedobacter sp. UYP1 TaxID=1756396 RepID=UPI003391D539